MKDKPISETLQEILSCVTAIKSELAHLSESSAAVKARLDDRETYYDRGVSNTRALLDGIGGSSFTPPADEATT